jgi:hypothetical protein
MEPLHRIARIERASAKRSEDSFEFPMILATEGEASDGHVLSIRGGRIPERMPLLAAHWADPEATLGSVVAPEKRLAEKPAALAAVGTIELGGVGARAEQRRDVALMIERGHLGAVSIRWDGIKSTPRRNLPSDHPAFVPDDEKNPAKRFGLFFEEWRALEGSVVPIGADPKALIQRAEETAGEVAEFWRAFAGEAGEPLTFDWRGRAVDLLAEGVRCAREGKVSDDELVRVLADVFGIDLVDPDSLPPVAPSAAPPVRQFGADDLRALFAEHETALRAGVGELFARATGRRF